jgi:hypothetical protein
MLVIRQRQHAPDPLVDLHGELQQSRARLSDLHRKATALRDEPDLLRRSLITLLDSDSALSEVAERSYSHPNGFAKIVLFVGGGYGIRLHVWHRKAGRWVSDSHPHGHRWEFASWIVIGGLHETTFTEAEEGDEHFRCEYRRNSIGEGVLRPARSAALRVVGKTVRLAGTVYECSRTRVHTVTPAGQDLVASLVLQGPRSFDPTPVYLQPGEAPVHDERRLSPAELRKVLAEVVVAT